MADESDVDIQTRDDGSKWVPYSRFEKVVAARNDYQTKIQSYEQSQAQAQTQIAEWQQKYERGQKEYQTRFALTREGVDDSEVQDFILSRHQATGQDKPFETWYGEYKATNPRILQPFQKVAAPQVTESVPPTQQVVPQVVPTVPAVPPRPVDGSNNGIVPRQPPVSAMTPEQIATMDMATWRSMKQDILKSV